jgi:hypothetical protein
VTEFNNITARILLTCALGEDVTEQLIDYYWNDGKKEQIMLADALRLTFTNLMGRFTDPHVILFPFLSNTYLTYRERMYKRNALKIREVISGIVDRRRETIKKDPEEAKRGDLVTLLLQEELF